jgi:tryptophan synthase alpha chain
VNRLERLFAASRRAKGKALVVYVCAGDPDLETTERLVPALAEAGADVIELGVPFSDPLADGPTIQAASQRALAAGTSLTAVLGLVRKLRRAGTTVPIVLFGYMNPILRMGLERFVNEAADAGADGVLVADLPLEESEALSALALAKKLSLVLLAAPTTPPERLLAIGKATRGFLYFVSVTGVTGARSELPPNLPKKLAEVRAATTAAVAVGFGVSTPEQARALAAHADAVVVGSALVEALHRGGADPSAALALVRSLAEAVHSQAVH